MDHWVHRINEDLIGRITGPMKFRLILQPLMAAFFAIRAGLKDAKEGRTPYSWSLLSHPETRTHLLEEGWKQVGRVFLLAIGIDALYQWIQLRAFYPGEALVVAIVLAIVPYLLLRGTVNRLARHSKEKSHGRK